jgi:hypothetical protein
MSTDGIESKKLKNVFASIVIHVIRTNICDDKARAVYQAFFVNSSLIILFAGVSKVQSIRHHAKQRRKVPIKSDSQEKIMEQIPQISKQIAEIKLMIFFFLVIF